LGSTKEGNAMAKTACRPQPTTFKDLSPQRQNCPACGQRMWLDYTNRRTLVTLDGCLRLNLAIRRCHTRACDRHLRPYRPEAEGRFALPKHEFGLDVLATVGALRYSEHRSVPEIHAALLGRDVGVSERTVTNLLDRYDELLAVALGDDRRLKKLLAGQGRVILAIDGLQPDVGHEVLWVIRDCLGGEILLAKSLLSARQEDLAELLTQVHDAVGVPVVGVVSDGQHSIRKAIAKALPGVPHQLCQFHYLREAARPIYEADRHAKKELKKKVRQVRGIERSVEGRGDAEAEVIKGYCSAVRSALTDDGRPPLEASGLKLQQRLQAIAASLDRVEEKGGRRLNSTGSRA
jgi:Transposase, Mutator family